MQRKKRAVNGWPGVRATCIGLVLAAWLLPSGQARPAPWYWWHSRAGASAPVCAQFMPSQGWQRGGQPYADPRCTQALPRHAGAVRPGAEQVPKVLPPPPSERRAPAAR